MDSSYLRGLRVALKASEAPLKVTLSKKHKFKTKNKSKGGGVRSREHAHEGGDILTSEIRASIFRFLNEKLYKCSSEDASRYFSENPSAFKLYHEGFQNQLQKWPYDPLTWAEEVIRNGFKKKPVVADMGCGDARLALRLGKVATVHSFDLVAVNERVTACDMAHTPLAHSSVDVVLFCLALMGTNCRDFLYEANRLLKMGFVTIFTTNTHFSRTLLIVEVASRFGLSFKKFLRLLKPFGFEITQWEITKDTYFAHGRLSKVKDISNLVVSSLPNVTINPCLYKKR
uniref:Ribosomal RNA-processing protein 8 n=1 Tax=Echinococcus granulosus TaxID=6210 RepID=A0A068W9Y7_ECHGR|nr:Ribosomal RNA processing protein 8 [Echinococcus granulosus]